MPRCATASTRRRFRRCWGHEGAGVVEAVGRAVSRVRPGDAVVLSVAYCTHCSQCLAGNMAYCENLFAEDFGGRRSDGSTSLSPQDGSVVSSHFFGQSSFSTYANVVESSVVPVSASAPLEILAPLGCGMQTGAGAVLDELRPQAGSSFAVSGAGAVGLAAVMTARLAGCSPLIAIDLHDSRLEPALELGATHVVNARNTDVRAELMRITAGRGVNYILDTTALPTVLTALARALSIRGTLGLVGSGPAGTEVPFEIGESLVKGWTFKTIIQGSSVPQLFVPRLAELWEQDRFPFDKLIKHYPFEDINTALADSESGDPVKPVLVF